MKTIIIIISTILISAILFSGCTQFGTRPSKTEKKLFDNSSQYNKEKGEFENRRPQLIAEMKKKSFNFGLVIDWFSDGKDRVPENKLPEIKPDLDKFLSASDDIKVIWFGHTTFLLNLNGIIILVDPVFSGSAAPVSFMVKRFQKPVLDLSELPKIDYILISHDHYDHLDMESIEFFKDKDIQFVTPLGVGSHLIGWGIAKENIIEKDWWQEAEFTDVKFIATPAQHFSGRDGFNENETLWASWVIQSKKHNIYFTGDSGYDTHFKAIGEKYGPFDVAFVESGQYDERWREVHMSTEDAVKAFTDLKAKKYFPVHWGMFELAMHTWYDPMVRLSKLSKEQNFDLLAPKIGQMVNVNQDNKFDIWWE
jgi:L-ascorbate metabolism protein UlaG (beta-lactamase superfamily)